MINVTNPNDSNAQSKPTTQSPSDMIESGLVLVAMPIGNASDISIRALEVLASADLVACEDTRVSSKLFAIHGLNPCTLSYHEHNAASQRPKLINRMSKGETVALVSDAGMPLISDPGYKLVTECLTANIPVTCAPGPSSVLVALALSGMPTDRFFFQGFLPSKQMGRCRILSELTPIPGSLVIMESANRLTAMLRDSANILGNRKAAVTRELTKRFEEVRRGKLDELATHYEAVGPPKGEIIVVISPQTNDAARFSQEALDTLLSQKLLSASLRDAVDQATIISGWARRDVYKRALRLNTDNTTDVL